MALGEAGEIGAGDIFDAAFIDFTISYQSILDEFAEPGGGERVKFVVVSRHTNLSYFRMSVSR